MRAARPAAGLREARGSASVSKREFRAGRQNADASSSPSCRRPIREGAWRPPSVHRARKQAARADHQDDEKGNMAGENLPLRIDVRANGLRQPDDDAADKRAPETTKATDDHRLERIQQAR